MYQLATDCRSADKTRLFIETCTAMAPNAENMRLVRAATSLVRGVLNGADIAPLREFVQHVEQKQNDADDVLAAAGQSVIDQLGTVPRIGLHDVVRRIAQIERDALAARGRCDVEPKFRPVCAS